MQKLGYDLYWSDGERAQNKDNNNLYLEGEVENGVIKSIDSITDYEGNVLVEKPEIIGEMNLVNISKVNIDFALAAYPSLSLGLECNGGEDLIDIDVPLEEVINVAVDKKLTGNLLDVLVGGDMATVDVVWMDFTNGNISYRNREHVGYVSDTGDEWFISMSDPIIKSTALYPLYLSYAQAKDPNISSIESIDNMNENSINRTICSTCIEKHKIIR